MWEPTDLKHCLYMMIFIQGNHIYTQELDGINNGVDIVHCTKFAEVEALFHLIFNFKISANLSHSIALNCNLRI